MGKTFLSLFSEFEKDEVCQLYIYPTVPDIDACSSYYRVTDKDVLDSILKFKKPGSELDKSKITADVKNLFENEDDAKLYRTKDKNSPIKRLLRDAMWRVSHWYTEELESWLDREAPTAIFLSPGYAKFIYDIALKISKKLNIPIITYICDDYYFVKTPKSLLGKLQLGLLRKKTDKLMKNTSHLITICDEIKELYEARFGVPATTIMTGASLDISRSVSVSETPCAISYFGNIGCNRYVSIAEIGHALDEINLEDGSSYRLNIYTGEKRPEILGVFDDIRSINLCGFISGKEFNDTLLASDILLHTEAFDNESIDLVKHSVSTKIADSLASGVPLFAYGPAEVASMKHLIKHDAAIACTSPEELEKTLSEALSSERLRRQKATNGLATAKEFHNAQRNSMLLREKFEKLS